MMDQVICRSKRDKTMSPIGYRRIDATSHACDIFRSCSPFLCGPVPLYGGYTAKNVENAYQFAKVYRAYADENGDPTDAYFAWAHWGWSSAIAQRRPMGYAMPLYTLWDGERLNEVEARKRIYLPLYSFAVVRTDGFRELKRLYDVGEHICLFDYEAYDNEALDYGADDIIADMGRSMGHAFVLKFLLDGDFEAPDLACNI